MPNISDQSRLTPYRPELHSKETAVETQRIVLIDIFSVSVCGLVCNVSSVQQAVILHQAAEEQHTFLCTW